MTRQIAVAITCLLALASAGPVQAKGKHHGHHHHGHHHLRSFVYVAPVYATPSCGYYYVKWQNTGSFYWKKQYYACKGCW